MKLYIDTNTYLSYISLTSDIKSLEKLKKLLIDKKLELVLPSQTKKEFFKHSKNKIKEIKDKLGNEIKISVPNELKKGKKQPPHKDEKEIIRKIDELNADLKKYRLQQITELTKHLDTVEILINDIFKLATFLEYTDEVILKSLIRYTKGLPPRKEKDDRKTGDAIIWETLKEYIRTEELAIVSTDGDFAEISIRKSSIPKINKILKKEWKQHTNQNLSLYPLLGNFVNSIEKENPVSADTIKTEATQATILATTQLVTNFAQTQELYKTTLASTLATANHSIITELVNSPSLTNAIYLSEQNTKSVLNTLQAFNTHTTFNYNSILNNRICEKCGKSYYQSVTTIQFANLCDVCSKNQTILTTL